MRWIEYAEQVSDVNSLYAWLTHKDPQIALSYYNAQVPAEIANAGTTVLSLINTAVPYVKQGIRASGGDMSVYNDIRIRSLLQGLFINEGAKKPSMMLIAYSSTAVGPCQVMPVNIRRYTGKYFGVTSNNQGMNVAKIPGTSRTQLAGKYTTKTGQVKEGKTPRWNWTLSWLDQQFKSTDSIFMPHNYFVMVGKAFVDHFGKSGARDSRGNLLPMHLWYPFWVGGSNILAVKKYPGSQSAKATAVLQALLQQNSVGAHSNTSLVARVASDFTTV